MNTGIYVTVFLLVAWIAILVAVVIFFNKLGLRYYKPKEILTKEGDTKINYPVEYLTLFKWAFWVYFPGVLIVSFIVAEYFFGKFQRYLFVSDGVVTFSSSIDLGYWFIAYWLVFFVITAFVAKTVFRYKYPRFDEYQALRSKLLASEAFKKLKKLTQHRKTIEASERYDEKKLAESKYYEMFMYFFIVWIVFVGPSILSFDDYVITDATGVRVNSFISITEKTIQWQQIKAANISAETYHVCRKGGCRGPYLRPHLYLISEEGRRYDAWNGMNMNGSPIEEIEQLISLVESKNIPIYIRPLNPESVKVIKGWTSIVQQNRYFKIFNYKES